MSTMGCLKTYLFVDDKYIFFNRLIRKSKFMDILNFSCYNWKDATRGYRWQLKKSSISYRYYQSKIVKDKKRTLGLSKY